MPRLRMLGVLAAASAACAPRAARPATAPGTATVIAAAPVSSIDTTRPGARDAFQRANEAAAAVDTIVVRPDTLILHVGQVMEPWTAITIEARNVTGDLVPNFAPMMQIEDQSIVEFTATGLVPRQVGLTKLVISPMSVDPTVRVRAVRAVVVLQVRP